MSGVQRMRPPASLPGTHQVRLDLTLLPQGSRNMTDNPQVWHYGLVARWWAEFNTDGPEIAYFKGLVERYGEPALDVACGTGRLLIPFLPPGMAVDGCAISPG